MALFETKRRRGFFLVVIGVLLLVVTLSTNYWASTQAEHRATSAESLLRADLTRTTVFELLLSPLTAVPHSDLRSIERTAEGGVDVTVGVNSLWQYRCVVGHLDSNGQVTTKRFRCNIPG